MLIPLQSSGYGRDGTRRLFLDFGSDAPDMSGTNRAAEANAALSKESLDFYKQVYADGAPDRERAADTAYKTSEAQLASMTQNDAISKDYYDYAKSTFRPVEQGIVADAQAYDTEARRESEAAKSMADVASQAASAREVNNRAMLRTSVNPNSGKMILAGNQMAMDEAVAKAGAANKARSLVETQGFARKMDAASLGRGLASSQATSAGVSLNAGNSAVTNASIPLQQTNQAVGVMGQGFTTAIQGNASAGQLYTNIANVENTARGQDMALLGAAMGAGANAYKSDMTKKKNIKPVTDEEALAAVEKTPVSTWQYKDGEGDGGQHTGPMAQHVQKNMGDDAAPGGTQIDPITMNGITMASVAALSRKVDKLMKEKRA